MSDNGLVKVQKSFVEIEEESYSPHELVPSNKKLMEDCREQFPNSSHITSLIELNEESALADSLHEILTHELAIKKKAFNEVTTVNLTSLEKCSFSQ